MVVGVEVTSSSKHILCTQAATIVPGRGNRSELGFYFLVTLSLSTGVHGKFRVLGAVHMPCQMLTVVCLSQKQGEAECGHTGF